MHWIKNVMLQFGLTFLFLSLTYLSKTQCSHRELFPSKNIFNSYQQNVWGTFTSEDNLYFSCYTPPPPVPTSIIVLRRGERRHSRQMGDCQLVLHSNSWKALVFDVLHCFYHHKKIMKFSFLISLFAEYNSSFVPSSLHNLWYTFLPDGSNTFLVSKN